MNNSNFELIEFSHDELEKLLNDSTMLNPPSSHHASQPVDFKYNHYQNIACKPPTPVTTPSPIPESPLKIQTTTTTTTTTKYDFTTVKYVTSYYLLEEGKYGIEKIIISSKHELCEKYDPQELCSEKQTHYHYVVKFHRMYYDNCINENKPLFPGILEIKVTSIKTIEEYNNFIGFIVSLKRGINYKFVVKQIMPRSQSPNLGHVAKKRKHEDISNDDSNVDDDASNIGPIVETVTNNEITVDHLNKLKESAKRSNSVKMMEEYFTCLNQSNKEQETKKQFNEIIEKEKPMTEYEYEVLRYDYDMRMSVFRACHILDLIDARNQIQSKSDVCPIYVLVGGKSCGKSKIAYHVANTIGKCAFPLVAYTHNDHAALSEWYESGSDVLVFEDFDFNDATDPNEPHKIITNLKKWSSGQEIYFLDALKLSKHSHSLRARKLRAIFICTNKSDESTLSFFQNIPDKTIEFEFLRFGPEYSYNPIINPHFLNMYPDSCSICDKSMYKFLQHYQKCKSDLALNNSARGFHRILNHLPAKYPYSIEFYTTDFKYALMCNNK